MPAEVLLERGVGETRAAVVDGDRILEAHVERGSLALRAGDVVAGRLTRVLDPGRRGLATADGLEILVEPLSRALTEGAACRIEIVRDAIPEPGRPRAPKGVVTDAPAARAPDLAARMAALGLAVRECLPHQTDALEAAGWSEVIEEARSGVIAFDGGLLTLSLTPAMTVIDVDGALPPAELARAAATACGQAIRRLGLAGSIGIDFPTVAGKAERQAIAEALDAALAPLLFERTAVNGFGFLQIVRRRSRASLPELVQGAPAETAALALLRRAERAGGAGRRTLAAAPAVIAWLEARPTLLDDLSRRLGAAVALRADPALAISAGHVDVAQL